MILDAEMAMTNSDIINVNTISFIVGFYSRLKYSSFSSSTKQIHGTFQVQHLRQGQQYRGKGH